MSDWRDRALCREVDPELFFNETTDAAQTLRAKKVCAGCGVRSECLEEQLARVRYRLLDFGVWGGTSPRDRDEIRKQRRAESRGAA